MALFGDYELSPPFPIFLLLSKHLIEEWSFSIAPFQLWSVGKGI